MGPEIKIDIYSVTLELTDDKKVSKKFSDLFSKFKTNEDPVGFHRFVKGFISTLDGGYTKNNKNTKAIKLNSDFSFNQAKHIITGTFKGGSTGVGGNLVKGDKEEEYDASAINSKHLFYLMWLPPKSNKGLLFVQGYSTFSAGSDFVFNFQKFIKDRDYGFALVINDYAPTDIINKFLKTGQIKKVKLKKVRVPSDKFEALEIPFKNGSELSMEISLTGNVLETIIAKWGIRKKGYYEIPSDLEDLGFDKDIDTYITFRNDGKETTIKSRNNFKASPNFYIPHGAVKRNKINNLPEMEELRAYCLSYLDKIKSEIYKE